MPLLIVPRESSVFCAAGMLMTDLKHDVVKSRVARLDQLPRQELLAEAEALAERGRCMLREEKVPEDRIRTQVEAEIRYVRQYHEVSLPLLPLEDLEKRFHAEHHRLYGYSLAEEKTPLELINLRARAIGVTDKPAARRQERDGPDAGHAAKGERQVWVPEAAGFRPVPVFDGHRLRFGNRLSGPAMVEERNTTLFVSAAFDAAVDALGSLLVYRREREDVLPESLRGELP
jgi:N-methylhydantoinase A